MATRCDTEKVHLCHIHQLDSWDVPECSCDSVILLKDDEGTESLDMSSVTHLAFASSDTLGFVHLLDVSPCLELLEEEDSLLGAFVILDVISDNQRNLRDALNNVSF